MRKIEAVLAAVVLVLMLTFLSSSAIAGEVIYTFSGVIDSFNENIPEINPGDPFTGVMSWDTSTVGSASSRPPPEEWRSFVHLPPHSMPLTSVTVSTSTGPMSFTQSPTRYFTWSMLNDVDLGITVDGLQGYFDDNATTPLTMDFHLYDHDAALWSSASTLPSSLDFSKLEDASVTLHDSQGNSAKGLITSMQASTVPLPGAAWLGAGLLGLLGAVRHRRRRSKG